MNKVLDINLKTIIFGIIILGLSLLIIELRGIIITIFISFIIFSALKPIVDFISDKGVPRFLSIVIVYLGIFTIFFGMVAVIFTQSIQQIQLIFNEFNLKADNINNFITNNFPWLVNFIDVDSLVKSIQSLSSNINLQSLSTNQAITNVIENLSPVATQGISFLGRFIGGLLSLFVIIFLSIYMISTKKDFYEEGLKLLPKRYSLYLNSFMDRIRVKLGSWLGGLLFLMLVIGIATYFIILIPGFFIQDYGLMRFAVIIAILAGLLEAIPNIGPILTLIIAVILTIATGGTFILVIYVVLMFILLQQAESIFLVPTVMKRAIDINPILSIVAVLIGFQLGGPIGALLSVPIAGVLLILITDYLKFIKEKN